MNRNIKNQNFSIFNEPFFSETNQALLSLSENEREQFEERASIMEFDGGLSREEAEWRALIMLIEGRPKIAV